jgi:NADH-quinone oxidoreductase subunit H
MPPFDFANLGTYLYELLGWQLKAMGLAPWLAALIQQVLVLVIVGSFVLVVTAFNIWLERKIAGRMQDRLGPNRVGPYGLLQTIADAFKLFTKENIIPTGADRFVFEWAPILGVMAVISIWAVIPFARQMVGVNLDVGVVYIIAVSGIGSLAIMLMGYASNNKYALLGAFRAVSQLISYEVPLILAVMVPVLLGGSLSVSTLVEGQSIWYIFMVPIAALIFLISNIAEIGRGPFDLIEAESEIVAGFHIEYGGARFAMIFLAEFAHAFTISALFTTFFLGGWRGPGAEQFQLLGLVYFIAKSFLMYFVVMWVRLTLPRVRIDQMNDLNWKFLIPLAIASLIFAALIDKMVPQGNVWIRAAGHLLGNVILAGATLLVLRGVSQRWQNAESARVAKITAELAK